MLTLNKSAFMIATNEYSPVDLEDIKEILASCEDNEMAEILKYVKFNPEIEKSYEDKVAYYRDLLDKITSLTKVSYTDEDKELFLAYIMSIKFLDDPKALELCTSAISEYEEKESTLSDEIWFLCEKMKYSLLGYHASGNKWNFAEIKTLVGSLKANKERYDNLYNKLK